MLLIAGVLDDHSIIHNSRSLSDMADRLVKLSAEIKRNRYQRKAPPKCSPITPLIKFNVYKLHRLHPNWTQLQIANKLNINQGRVSEILHGKRK